MLNEYGKNFRYVLLDFLETRKVSEYRHRVQSWTNRRDGAANRSVASMNDPVIQAGKIWEQHCSWCQRCDLAIPRCELGRKAYDFYAFILRVAAWVAQDNSTTRLADGTSSGASGPES